MSGLLDSRLERQAQERVQERAKERGAECEGTYDDSYARLRVACLPAALRSLDAIHVASAPAMGTPFDSLITYDKRMLDAAREAGLAAHAPGMAD
ncbi:hypothetical protein OG762_09710 [Streptomyces sp. NBC_01136]|uniref:hypothetical protein n=1 Tax=unclassified Streptomyces TaxID=2593676 RepID=UPI003244D481|nr:hypothetical protein OG762_09710 [Streptomyces sp. NBC_01136]